MKNEYVFKAERNGIIESVRVKSLQAVPKDFVMVKFEPIPEKK